MLPSQFLGVYLMFSVTDLYVTLATCFFFTYNVNRQLSRNAHAGALYSAAIRHVTRDVFLEVEIDIDLTEV